jgi:hypothetical protein
VCPINEEPIMRRIHKTADKREWLIIESHPLTDEQHCVCRAIENGYLRHTAIIARADLKEQKRKGRVLISDVRLMQTGYES